MPARSRADNSQESRFKALIIHLIKSYQKYDALCIQDLRVNLQLSDRDEEMQMPASPKRMEEVAEYTFQLVSLVDFELTAANQGLKRKILKTFEMPESELQKIDGGNSVMLKSLIIHSIMSSQNVDQHIEYLKHLEFDLDVYYIICWLYFRNPWRLEKHGRLNQAVGLLQHFKEKHGSLLLDEKDREVLACLATNNVNSFGIVSADDVELSFTFSKLTQLVNQVDRSYEEFDLVGMLRSLRNAETGFDDGEKVIKLGIGYYRYLVIERATREWSREFLTTDTWHKYDFDRQWGLVWELYYQDKDSVPGNASIKSRIKKLIHLNK